MICDAGAVITNQDSLASSMKMISNHGAVPGTKNSHKIEGINSRLDGLQAAILSLKLKHLQSWTEARQHKAKYYIEGLASIDELCLPKVASQAQHVWHQFVIKTQDRDNLKKFLEDAGIPTVIHYPTALPFLNAYKYKKCKTEDYPNAHFNQDKILSLPIYHELSILDQDFIIDVIKRFFN